MKSDARNKPVKLKSLLPAEQLKDIKEQEKIKLQDFERRYASLEDDPDFMYSIMTSRVQEAMRAIPEDIKSMPQDQLERKVGADFDARMLRQAFWMEFDRVVRSKDKRFNLSNVHKGLVELKCFYRDWVGNSYRLEYLLRPPTELQVMWEELLYTSTMKIREILEMSTLDDKGKPNAKVMDLQLKTFIYLSDRRRGHVLGQARIEGQAARAQMQVNVAIANAQAGVQSALAASTEVIETDVTPQSLEEIEREIAAIEGHQLTAPVTDIIAEVVNEKEKQKV